MTTEDMRMTDAEATVLEGTSHTITYGELKARLVDKLTETEEHIHSHPTCALGIAFIVGAAIGDILTATVSSSKNRRDNGR